MKTRHVHLYAFLLTALTGSAAWAARDPFWPIGYVPPPPPEPTPVAAEPSATRPEAPTKPAEKTITDDDWALARKALVVSGFTQSVRPDGQTRTLAMVNRRMIAAGDTITLIHQDVRFLWRVESIANRSFQLTQVKAERLVPKPAELKQNQKSPIN
jgi:hypothetical protein